jgi:hypothetical protein
LKLSDGELGEGALLPPPKKLRNELRVTAGDDSLPLPSTISCSPVKREARSSLRVRASAESEASTVCECRALTAASLKSSPQLGGSESSPESSPLPGWWGWTLLLRLWFDMADRMALRKGAAGARAAAADAAVADSLASSTLRRTDGVQNRASS